MTPLTYWVLFCILVTLIVVIISYIIFNAVMDFCLTEHEENKTQSDSEEVGEVARLNKYQFNRGDVEDLTRIQGDFKTVLPNVNCVNEVDGTDFNRILKQKLNVVSLSDIHEEENVKLSEAKNVSVIKEKKGISKSVDDLEFCNPRGIDVLRDINGIEEKAQRIDEELNYFIGGANNVKFYEINEKLLRLMIALCDITCETEELRRKKGETLDYIEGCQKRLKSKA